MSKTNKRSVTPQPFSHNQLQQLDRRIELVGGIESAVEWYASTPEMQRRYTDIKERVRVARAALKSLQQKGARHKKTGRDQLARMLADMGKPQERIDHRVESHPVDVGADDTDDIPTPREQAAGGDEFNRERKSANGSVDETGIVVREGDWRFRIESKTAQAAKEAVVSLTDLAERLGYERASTLKELAGKAEHRENLNKFGQVRVSRIWVTGGVAPRQVDEPLYNKRQAMYLIAKSGTAISNDLTVEFIEALESLRERFEQTVSQPPAFDLGTIAAVVGATVSTAMASILGPMMERLLGDRPQNDARAETPRPQPQRATVYEKRESVGQERIRYGIDRREELNKLIRGRVPNGMVGREKSEFIRDTWHELHAALRDAPYLIEVNRGTTIERLSGRNINQLDWIVENGYLDLAIECAVKLFTRAA